MTNIFTDFVKYVCVLAIKHDGTNVCLDFYDKLNIARISDNWNYGHHTKPALCN
jgi:hypothetical protein